MSRWGCSLGIVLWRDDPVAPSWFHPFDGSPPRRLPRIPLTPPRACSLGAPGSDPDAITFWFGRLDSDFGPATVEDGLLESPGFASPTRYEVEWARGEMCVRAVTLNRGGMGAEGIDGVTMTLSARPGDRFVGSLGDAGTFRVECRASREPPSVARQRPWPARQARDEARPLPGRGRRVCISAACARDIVASNVQRRTGGGGRRRCVLGDRAAIRSRCRVDGRSTTPRDIRCALPTSRGCRAASAGLSGGGARLR